MLTLLGYKGIVALSSVLPSAWQYAFARRLADFQHRFDRKGREAVTANLRVILGPDAPDALVAHEARWVFRSFGAYLCEFFGYHRFGKRFIDRQVVVLGRENLDAALKLGRGVILLFRHYSNWELGATVVAQMGYPIMAITQMHADPHVNAMFVGQREKRGVQVVHSQHGAKSALKALRQNQTVAMLADRTTGGPVVPVQLFGRQTFLPQGPWRMALTSGAPLLPTFVQRRFHGGYALEFGAPIPVPVNGTRDERMAAMAQAWTARFEVRLRAEPSQWATFFRVWDDPVTGEAGRGQSLAAPEVPLPGTRQGSCAVQRVDGRPVEAAGIGTPLVMSEAWSSSTQ